MNAPESPQHNNEHRAPILNVIHIAGGKVVRMVTEPGKTAQTDVTHIIDDAGHFTDDEQHPDEPDDPEPEMPLRYAS